MNELLKKLLEAEVLSEETAKELTETFAAKIAEAEETAKKEAADTVRAELTNQWVEERDQLIEAIDTKVNEYLASEMEELHEDIGRFRDLEVEHAEKLAEAKASMGQELKGDMSELVEKLDAFLEIRLTAEVEELREDIQEVKKLEFGRKLYEGFVLEFKNNFMDEDSAHADLSESVKQNQDLMVALEEAETKIDDMQRAEKMFNLLGPLVGKQKDAMEIILSNVSTNQLEEGYNTFIGRILKEHDDTAEKETKVLAKDQNGSTEETVVLDGNEENNIMLESYDTSGVSDLDKLRRLAGIIE